MGDFLADWHAWRDAREARLRSPHGWLAVTAIHWLTSARQRFDDVPGEWYAEEERVAALCLAPDETLSLDGVSLATGLHRFGPLDHLGLTFSFDDAVAQVAERDGSVIVRPRHPDSPKLQAYRGTPCFPADPRWVVPAVFDPYPEPEGDAVGELVFEHAGAVHRLVAWGEDDGSLWVLFRDATTGVTTDHSNRQLVVDPPSSDARAVIDFNRAYNMPCAYTEFATCPVPPEANTLPFPVEAGEQTPMLA